MDNKNAAEKKRKEELEDEKSTSLSNKIKQKMIDQQRANDAKFGGGTDQERATRNRQALLNQFQQQKENSVKYLGGTSARDTARRNKQRKEKLEGDKSTSLSDRIKQKANEKTKGLKDKVKQGVQKTLKEPFLYLPIIIVMFIGALASDLSDALLTLIPPIAWIVNIATWIFLNIMPRILGDELKKIKRELFILSTILTIVDMILDSIPGLSTFLSFLSLYISVPIYMHIRWKIEQKLAKRKQEKQEKKQK